MAASVEHWLTAAYWKRPPRMVKVVEMAQDDLPSDYIQRTLDGLKARWMDMFDTKAGPLSKFYLNKMQNHTDAAFRQALKDAGWSVEFKMNPAMRDALNAEITENIGLVHPHARGEYAGCHAQAT